MLEGARKKGLYIQSIVGLILPLRGSVMNKVALGIAAALATVGAAQAADMAVPAPAPAPVVSYDWTGLYFDVGIGWQKDSVNWAYANFPGTAPFSLSEGQTSITGHVGYQQQFGWLVVGGEVGAFRSTNSGSAAFVGPACSTVVTPNFVCQARIDSTSLAGGKLGVDWGNWLFYGVGGKAFNSSIATQIVNFAGSLADIGGNQNTTGWYWGAGIDYLLLKTIFGDLMGGVEYEHVNLNSFTQCTVPGGGVPALTGCPSATGNTSRVVSANEDAVWAKLTLKFNPFAH
jgi:outer membrane immunogenic protein